MTSVELSPLERKNIRRTITQSGSECVVLVGSVARGTRNSLAGDLDILILDGDGSKVLAPGLQVTVLSSSALAERVISGDDFAQWALRFGKVIRGRSTWTRLKTQLLDGAPWPRAEAKQKQACNRLVRARQLLDMGDREAAHEELMYAASHLARATLLEGRVFPLSRPELVSQLRQIQHPELAEMLEGLNLDREPNSDFLRRTLDRLENWLQGDALRTT